ncbi:unnamed protein product [Protopolystoma xenopodis]|uniref:Uncharacterized protein n=1 Tax=Protopolystoma xenopodis TaxID=117903 RepID=A0A3S5B3U6_9PLAT|nr:unnamed protein product [Protopolystoma xenopodis]
MSSIRWTWMQNNERLRAYVVKFRSRYYLHAIRLDSEIRCLMPPKAHETAFWPSRVRATCVWAHEVRITADFKAVYLGFCTRRLIVSHSS